MIYFDSGATSLQKPSAVANAMKKAVATCASPGRGGLRIQSFPAGNWRRNCSAASRTR